MRKLDVDDGKVTGERETDDGIFELEATLPAVVSVSEKIVETPVPVLQGHHGRQEEEGHRSDAGGIGVEADEVGGANAGTQGRCPSTPKPPKTAGEKVTDEGEGGSKIAEYLVAQKLI